jgi:hypothetical protein
MSDVLSIGEIKERFPSEWVLLEDVVANELMEISRGRVLWHSPDCLEVERKAREFVARRCAILFVGKLQMDAPFVL